MSEYQRAQMACESIKTLLQPFGIEPRFLVGFGGRPSIMVVVQYGAGAITDAVLAEQYEGIKTVFRELRR